MFPYSNTPSFQRDLMPGVLIGIVTNNKDPEKNGRVKLKFPIRDEQVETDWVRVVTPMGGKDRGLYMIPEVNDEVLVAFQMGELAEPIVIGSLWSSKNTAPGPANANQKNDIRMFKSRDGHIVQFDDVSGDGKITIKTKDGHTIEIADKNDTITIKEKSGQNQVTISGGSKNEVELKSGTSSIKFNNKGDMTLSSAKSITIKSAQVNIEASATLKMKANASADLQSSGILNVKGSMVKIN